MIYQWHVWGWVIELSAISGMLIGFSVPMWGQKDNRIWGLNLGPAALLLYRNDFVWPE